MVNKSKRIPYRTELEKHELIAQLMAEGYAPCVIDEELRLDKGYTRDWCRLVWSENKCRIFAKAEKMVQSEKRNADHIRAHKTAIKKSTEKRNSKNSVVAERYAGRNLERQNQWKD